MKPQAFARPAGGLLGRRRERGAALLIILLIALVVGLSALFSSLGQQQSEASRAARSGDQLVVAKAALIGYAASYHEQVNPDRVWGYLPCPDTNNDGAQDVNFALCPSGATQSVIGRLPYQTLGLPDLRDHTGECLWYVVSASHKMNNSTSPMNWDLRGNLKIVDQDGRVLADPDDVDGGAVAAIIAPGPPVAGQNRVAGNGRCSGDASNAINDWLEGNAAYVSPGAGTVVLRQGEVGSSSHNDRIAWITARELYAPIARRSDLLGSMLTGLASCLESQASLPVADKPGNMTTQGAGDPKLVSGSPGLDEILYGIATPPPAYPAKVPANCAWLTGSFTASLWNSWKDHVRYATCKDGSACLRVNGADCGGVLLFGGRKVGGAPRLAAEKTVTGYFEGVNSASLTGSGNTFTGASTYSAASPDQDIVMCLNRSVTLSSEIAIAAKTVADGPMTTFADRTLTLGDPEVDSGDAAADSLAGCAWIGGPLAFGRGLRAYFRYKIIKKGEGFAFAVVDADRNPSTSMCGAGDSHLGYAGLPPAGISNHLRYPKIGLEIDTHQQGTYSATPDSTVAGKNDPAGSHAALVFWGQHAPADDLQATTTYTYDDNVHGEPAAQQPFPPSTYPDPVNPAAFSLAGIDQLDAVRHVRIEIDRNYNPNAKFGTYAIKVWIDLNAVPPTGFSDTTTDYPGGSSFPTATINDLDASEAFKNFRLGFTNSAGSVAQQIQITQFEARTR